MIDDKSLVPNAGEKLTHTMKPVEGVQAPDAQPASQPNQPMGNRDEWQGKPVDANYGFVPPDKESVTANLKKVEADIQERFGLQSRGMEDPNPYPAKPDSFTAQGEANRSDPK